MKKRDFSTVILIVVFFVGLSLLLYPSISDYWNSFHQSRAIASYAENVATMDDDRYEHIWNDANVYNSTLWGKENRYILSEEDVTQYESLFNVTQDGIMGYIEIPSIKCSLPIYHGVEDVVLQIAIGHIPGTSLPAGGEGTHCALSGHRGLPSAKLFTDLDKLVVGDLFMLQILDETLSYEVDQILIVEPHELDALEIEPGKDLCTLITCTPYGINSHRLLVRGHRVENQAIAATVRVTADALQIEPILVAPAVAAPMLLLLLVWVLVYDRKKKR